MNRSFDGRTALVTGAGSGIGRASALAFAREGARVVAADIDDAGGEETVRLILEAGGEARFFRADVAEVDEVKAMVRSTVDVYGRLDYAHNNAGIEGIGAPLHEYPENIWDQVIRIDLTGVYLCMKYEIRHMLEAGGGAIVNTASVAGLIGASKLVAYTAAKHGVVGLTKVAGVDYAQAGIRVNAVCPTYIRTPMVERLLERTEDRMQVEARMAAAQPMARMGTPDEVAEAVVWLCSDAASFITGVALPIDGALVAR